MRAGIGGHLRSRRDASTLYRARREVARGDTCGSRPRVASWGTAAKTVNRPGRFRKRVASGGGSPGATPWRNTHSPESKVLHRPEAQRLLPFAACPRRRKVFGYCPSPQPLKEPKSLNHGPSGASGSDSLRPAGWRDGAPCLEALRGRGDRARTGGHARGGDGRARGVATQSGSKRHREEEAGRRQVGTLKPVPPAPRASREGGAESANRGLAGCFRFRPQAAPPAPVPVL